MGRTRYAATLTEVQVDHRHAEAGHALRREATPGQPGFGIGETTMNTASIVACAICLVLILAMFYAAWRLDRRDIERRGR
jgi:hypothetical protein